MVLKFIDKYRQEAWRTMNERVTTEPTWREAILESIFKPEMVHPGKEPMSHLHPRIKELHLPEGSYIADWRKYRVEDHGALKRFQERCHAAGMHDPWLRNYCHMFYNNQVGARSTTRVVTNGCARGFGIAVILTLGAKYFDIFH